MIDLVILTGVSGAGKTTALLTFEELGYYIVDNLPIRLIDELFKEFTNNEKTYRKAVICFPLNEASEVYKCAKKYDKFNIIFLGLDSKEDVLIERYRLTRHVHPLQLKGLSLINAIKEDQNLINKIKSEFTHYVDTSKFLPSELRTYIYDITKGVFAKKMTVIFSSFGYKKSVPLDLDMIIDARVLVNPYWDDNLKHLTGLDEKVKDYVLKDKLTKDFLKRITNYLDLYLSSLDKAGRSLVNIGVGCSGGQHRSVVIANYLKEYYMDKYHALSEHRDIPRSK